MSIAIDGYTPASASKPSPAYVRPVSTPQAEPETEPEPWSETKPPRSLHYVHSSADAVFPENRTVSVLPYAGPEIALISGDSESMYLHADDLPSAVVALIAGTGFVDRKPRDAAETKLQALALEFIDTFREAMVPNFRESLQQAIDGAKDDWDAKCRAAEVVSRYDRLR